MKMKKEEYYDSIVEEGNNISNLVSEMLTLMEIEDENKVVEIEDVELKDILLSEINRFKKLFEEKNVAIKLKLAKDVKIAAQQKGHGKGNVKLS